MGRKNLRQDQKIHRSNHHLDQTIPNLADFYSDFVSWVGKNLLHNYLKKSSNSWLISTELLILKRWISAPPWHSSAGYQIADTVRSLLRPTAVCTVMCWKSVRQSKASGGLTLEATSYLLQSIQSKSSHLKIQIIPFLQLYPSFFLLMHTHTHK